jgi:hypothetical protein
MGKGGGGGVVKLGHSVPTIRTMDSVIYFAAFLGPIHLKESV